MKPLDMLKAILAIAGIGVWGYGLRSGDRNVQIAGIALVVIAFLLRFFQRKRREPL